MLSCFAAIIIPTVIKKGLFLQRGNCYATAYKDILYNCVLPAFWQQSGKEPHMDSFHSVLFTWKGVYFHALKANLH